MTGMENAVQIKGSAMAIRPTPGSLESARTEQNITYIRQMLGELRAVADNENADMLCYLIEMAYLEAGDVLAGHRPLRIVKSQ
jgi:hypothetical protein